MRKDVRLGLAGWQYPLYLCFGLCALLYGRTAPSRPRRGR